MAPKPETHTTSVPVIEEAVTRLMHCLELIDESNENPKDTTSPSAVKILDSDETLSFPCITNADVNRDLQVNGVQSRGESKPTSYEGTSLIYSPAEDIVIVDYESELQMGDIMRLIMKGLSEPYSIYTYRYFIHNWPNLCLLAWNRCDKSYVGAIVCKLDVSHQNRRRGYIAMLAVDESCRKMGVGTRLVCKAIERMKSVNCDEVVLETEATNRDALSLYGNLGFIREKRLFRYYLNGVDAFRLKLFFTSPSQQIQDSVKHSSTQEGL